MTYTNKQISEKLTQARMIAERTYTMRWKRANDAAIKAHLGGIGCQLHNCFVGERWREVDYRYARLARHLLDTAHEPSRIIDRFYHRMIEEQRAAR